VATFDYNAEAGLYPCKTMGRATRVRYKRFASVAEALRFAIEGMPVSQLRGSILEVEEARYDGMQMRNLYEASDYPLPRHKQ
jgi:hypothetical protein